VIRTPLNLEVLMHFHCSNERFPRDTPAIGDAISYLIQTEMIDSSKVGVHCVTDKGHAYIKHILNVPFPKKTWVIPS
jgi:hypothetical protein